MVEDMDERVALALEQIHNDERLTADLPDPSAEAVLAWLESEVRAAGSLDEQAFSAHVARLRTAVKQVARHFADDPGALIEQAKALSSASGLMAAREPGPAPATPVAYSHIQTAAGRAGPRKPWRRTSRNYYASRRRRGWSP